MNTIEDAGIGVDALADRIAETAAMLDAGPHRLLTMFGGSMSRRCGGRKAVCRVRTG
jgi:hypothetical protein